MTNFHRFLIDFYSQGKTPYVPIIRKESEKELEIIGVGFFRYGKLVHQISMEEAFFFKLLADKYSSGWHDIEIDGHKAAIQNILSKREFHLTEASPPYEVTVKITGNGVKDKTFKKLEKKFEEEINKRGLELVNKFKELDIDPIGFGRVIKSKNRDFDYDKWRDEYFEDLKVKIDVNVDINEVGIVE